MVFIIFLYYPRTTFTDGQFRSEIQLLKPVNMDLSIKRNLSATWYHSIPDIQINAHLKPMSVSAYLFLCLTLAVGNISANINVHFFAANLESGGPNNSAEDSK